MATGSFTSFGTVPKGKGQYLSGEGERSGLETREATAFGEVGRKEDYQNLHRLNPCKKPGEKSLVLRANAASNVQSSVLGVGVESQSDMSECVYIAHLAKILGTLTESSSILQSKLLKNRRMYQQSLKSIYRARDGLQARYVQLQGELSQLQKLVEGRFSQQ